MAVVRLSVTEFLDRAADALVLDVRSPGEYNHAHIPGAFSLPLFDDEERKVVGTTYKQVSREEAIKIGLDYFGPKMRQMVEIVETKLKASGTKNVFVHCWRGGMRSGAVAWLLDLYGFEVFLLDGGYKAYRNWVLNELASDQPLQLIGGYTGSGKTYVLKELERQGHAIIDLEGIANHRGSAFGALDREGQPSAEMFENTVALQLHRLKKTADVIWVEDESQRIGDINMPIVFWNLMREKPIYFLEVPFEERLDHLVSEYGHYKREAIINAIIRIQKRLGGLETKTAINALLENDLRGCFEVLLKYYDKHYEKALRNRPRLEEVIERIPCKSTDPVENTQLVLERAHVGN